MHDTQNEPPNLFQEDAKNLIAMMNFKPFYWDAGDVDTEQGKKFMAFAYCHDDKSKSQTSAIVIDDYEPWIHAVLPPEITTREAKKVCNEIFNALVKRLGKDDHDPVRFTMSARLPYYYYSTGTHICMQIFFRTEDAARHCGNTLRYPIWTQSCGKISLTYCEDRISQLARFQVDKGVRTCTWFEVQARHVQPDSPEKMTQEFNEYRVSHKTLKCLPVDMQFQLGGTNPSYLVFDGEMMSNRKHAFPDQLNALDPVFMWGFLHCWWDLTRNQYQIDEYCLVYHKTIKADQIEEIPGSNLVSKKVENGLRYEVLEDGGRKVHLLWYANEIDLANGFEQFIIDKDPDALIGHNSNAFDFPYHKIRKARILEPFKNVSRRLNWVQAFEHIKWSSSAYKSIEMDIPNGPGRIYFDTMLMAKRDPVNKFDSYQLDVMSQELLGIGKHSWSPDKIFDSFRGDDSDMLRKTIIYCMRDVWCTWGIFTHLNSWHAYASMSNVIGIPIFDVFGQGQGKRTIAQAFRECYNRGYYLSSPDVGERVLRGIAGARVFQTHPGIHEYVLLFDFAGLYPSIMDRYNISNDTCDKNKLAPDDKCNIFKWTDDKGDWETRWVKPELREGIVPLIIRALREARQAAKKRMAECKAAGDIQGAMLASVEEQAIKISMNSIYGALSQPTGYLGLEEGGATVTAIGRMLVGKAATWLEGKGYMIVYGDTDSVMIKRIAPLSEAEKLTFREDGLKLLAELNEANFQKPIYMEMDGAWRVMFAQEKKVYNYIPYDAKNPNNIDPEKMKSKGSVDARRDSCKMIRNLYKRLSKMITSLQPPEEIIMAAVEEVERLMYGDLKIEEMIIIKAIGENYEGENVALGIYSRYLNSIGLSVKPGDRVPYVLRVKPDARKAGEFFEDPEVFTRENHQYNRLLYLKSQFANKLDKLLHIAFPTLIPEDMFKLIPNYLGMGRIVSVAEIVGGIISKHASK